MKIVYGLFFLLSLLAGCSKATSSESSSGGKFPSVIAEMESNGELPVLDRSASLGGVDANKNGIRDDIELLIASQHRSPEETQAMQQFARAIQSGLSSNIKTRDEVQSNSVRVGKAIGCLFDRSGNDAERLFKLINGSTKNTRARILEEDRVDELASGMVFDSYGSEDCE